MVSGGITQTTKGIVQGTSSGFYGIFASLFRKIGWRWSITAIIVFIIFGSAIVDAFQGNSFKEGMVIFVEEFAGQVALSDHELETRTKEIIENPQYEEYDLKLHKYDNKKYYMFPLYAVYNGYQRTKYYLNRLSVFVTLFVNLWFLYMLLWILYIVILKVLVQDDSKTTLAWVMALIVMLLLQSVFSAATYEKPDNWNDLSLLEKGQKIMPFRGTVFMFSHIGDLLAFGKERLVDPIKPLNITVANDLINQQPAEIVM